MILSVILRDIIITFSSLSHHQHHHSDDNHSDDNQCNPQGHHYHIIITLSSLSHNDDNFITIIQMIISVMIRDKHGKEQIVCLADDHRKNRHHTSLFVRNCKLVRSLISSSSLFCHCLPAFSSSLYFERNQAIRFPLSSTILNGKVSDKYLQKWYSCQTSRTCKSAQHLQSLQSSWKWWYH